MRPIQLLLLAIVAAVHVHAGIFSKKKPADPAPVDDAPSMGVFSSIGAAAKTFFYQKEIKQYFALFVNTQRTAVQESELKKLKATLYKKGLLDEMGIPTEKLLQKKEFAQDWIALDQKLAEPEFKSVMRPDQKVALESRINIHTKADLSSASRYTDMSATKVQGDMPVYTSLAQLVIDYHQARNRQTQATTNLWTVGNVDKIATVVVAGANNPLANLALMPLLQWMAMDGKDEFTNVNRARIEKRLFRNNIKSVLSQDPMLVKELQALQLFSGLNAVAKFLKKRPKYTGPSPTWRGEIKYSSGLGKLMQLFQQHQRCDDAKYIYDRWDLIMGEVHPVSLPKPVDRPGIGCVLVDQKQKVVSRPILPKAVSASAPGGNDGAASGAADHENGHPSGPRDASSPLSSHSGSDSGDSGIVESDSESIVAESGPGAIVHKESTSPSGAASDSIGGTGPGQNLLSEHGGHGSQRATEPTKAESPGRRVRFNDNVTVHEFERDPHSDDSDDISHANYATHDGNETA